MLCWGFPPSLAVSVVGSLFMCVLVQNAETGICEGGITAVPCPLSSNPDPVTCFCDLVDLRLGVHSAKMESVKEIFEQFAVCTGPNPADEVSPAPDPL